MGLDNYWAFDIDDVTGVEPGDQVTITHPNRDGGDLTEETYEIDGDQDRIPAWVADAAGVPEHPDFDEETLSLVGGVVSGHGPHSFRGKVYSSFIQEVTGETLYADRLENETVREIAEALEACDWNDATVQTTFDSEREFEDFCEMWSKYADAGAWLHGWW